MSEPFLSPFRPFFLYPSNSYKKIYIKICKQCTCSKIFLRILIVYQPLLSRSTPKMYLYTRKGQYMATYIKPMIARDILRKANLSE